MRRRVCVCWTACAHCTSLCARSEYFESVAGTPAELLENIATRLKKVEAEEAAAGAAGAGASGAGAGAGAGDAGAGDEESKA